MRKTNVVKGTIFKEMNSGKEPWRNIMPVIMVVFGFIVLAPIVAQADTGSKNLNPDILPPNSKPYGLTYGEWSAKWWQWALSIPTSQNPLVDSDGSSAANGQSGQVWFLAGKLCVTACPVATANRVVDVPAGKALFFPILNAEADNLWDPPTAYSEAELRTFAKANMDSGENIVAEVDGVPIEGLGSSLTTRYRVTSPVFTYHIPENNIYSLFGLNFPEQDVSGAVADGIFVMLAPLPAGTHTIHFAGNFGTAFALDIHYTINVVPDKS